MKPPAAFARPSSEGRDRWFFGGGIHRWLATSAETGGALILFEDQLEGGKTTPLHRHPDADETLFVLEGSITVSIDAHEHVLGEGGMSFAPVDTARVSRDLRRCSPPDPPDTRCRRGVLLRGEHDRPGRNRCGRHRQGAGVRHPNGRNRSPRTTSVRAAVDASKHHQPRVPGGPLKGPVTDCVIHPP